MVTACEGGLTQQGKSDIISQFWPVWLELEDQLYSICLELMNSNQTEAEDALSQARIKAWEQLQKHAGQIENLRAWLMRLTINLCKDIIRKSSRGPAAVEDIEWVGNDGLVCTASSMPSPEKVLETLEMSQQIRRAIASLPQRLRDTFVLHFYEELKHTEIAERLGISYANVCKRISLARKRLVTSLRGYFRDEEDPATALESAQQKSPTPVAQVEKQKVQLPGEKRQETATVSAGKKPAPVVVEAKPELVSCAVDPNAKGSCDMKEVADRASGPLSEPTPQAIVDDSQGKETASAIAPVAVEEKPEYVTGVVPTTVLVEQKLSQVCTRLEERSRDRTPVASGEKQFLYRLGRETATVSTAIECVPVAVEALQDKCCCASEPKDIVGQNIKKVGSNGSARSPGGTAIVEKLNIQFSTSRECRGVAVGEILDFVWDAVLLWDLLGRKIKEVCGQLFARSRDRWTPAIVEKQKT